MNAYLLNELSRLILESVTLANEIRIKGSAVLDQGPSAFKGVLHLEETIRSLRSLLLEKEGAACPFCDKKILHLKQHLQTSLHACDACSYVAIYDMDAHHSVCLKSLRQKENDATKSGLIYIHSEKKAFKVNPDKTVYDAAGAYVGCLRPDSTLDKTVKEKDKIKESEPCLHCNKKFSNMKLHIKNSHMCDYCETEVADKYKHYDTCSQMIEQLTDLAKERGLTYVHSELAEYKVQAGNYYEWDDKTSTVGAYAGRLRSDGTLDKTAAESFALKKEKEKSPESCPHCDKKLMNLESHIYNIHTCAYCKDTTVHSLDDHACKPYLKHVKYVKESHIRQGINYIQNDTYIERNGNVYKNPFKYPSKKYDYVGRLRTDGTIDRSAPQVLTTDGGQCTYCQNNYGNMKAHLLDTHTCLWCHATGLKDKDDHMRSCKEYIKWDAEPTHQIAIPKKKKERIPAHIKTIVWRTYIGNEKPEAKCYCCNHETVDIRNFECGHVTAEAKGGPLTVDNLRPICRGCNGAMGTMSMEEYCQKFFGRSVHTAAAEDVFGIFTGPSIQVVTDPFVDLLG